MATKRLEPGDVLAISGASHRIYAQFLGRYPQYGDAILVCTAPAETDRELTPAVFRDAYVTFYPAAAAVRNGLASVVGNLPSPALPRRYRRAGAIDNDGRVLTWLVEDDTGTTVKDQLSANERQLPIAEILNHEMLLYRVSERWRPEQEA